MNKKCFLNINNKKVFFSHKTDNDIIKLFSEALENAEKKHKIIGDNKSIQIGWNYYIFKKVKDFYQIFVVDYTKNPFKNLTEDLTLSLKIMKEQLLITKKTGLVSDEIITFQDTLLVKKSALNCINVYFEKKYKKENNDSGWYMGNLDDTKPSNNINDYETIPLYKLLSICPKAISIMNLPVGTIAIIKDNEIIGICDSNNNEVYANI